MIDKEITSEETHSLIVTHLDNYQYFIQEILDVKMVFGLSDKDARELVVKRYPEFKEN